ncbi:hypothetical protein NDU88_000650 [Pleurodeles waltl]|uniref:Uncharacterized protein n=1 Tax=Pleurodeles waltl TaxID=8319 RepID=A0AAV7V7G9_PLEWA|nr:hypothetical protein NDU88_000650 [Pleurodeles waltl]
MTTRAAGLATAIPLAVKERIWRKEFIDIFSLLEIQLEGLDLTTCNKKEEDRRERKRARKEKNFENWLGAFRIMACVIVEKFPRCAADLWLYESEIHEEHSQFPGDAWLEYDKNFRLKMQAHPEMKWNEEDVSSYIHKMMVAKEVSSWAARGDQSFRKTRIPRGNMRNKKHPIRTNPGTAVKGRATKDHRQSAGNSKQMSTFGGRTASSDPAAHHTGEHPASACKKSRHRSDKKEKRRKH